MADRDASVLPPVSADHRRIAAGQFERANQVIATGNFDYGIRLLIECLKLDPANLIYRQTIRRTQKLKYGNNLRGSALAWLLCIPGKARVKRAKRAREHLRVLLLAEQVLNRNPWDVGTQMDVAESAEVLGLLDLAVWSLKEARQKEPNHLGVNRALARLLEQRGNFQEAMVLWEMVRRAAPTDVEAMNKAKDLAAHDTIARGNYEEAITTTPTVARVKTGETSQEHSALKMGPGAKKQGDLPKEQTPVNRAQRDAAPMQAKIDADPTNPNGYLNLASHLRKNGQIDQAKDVLSKGLPATGNHFEMQVELRDLEIEPFRRNLHLTEERLHKQNDEELRKIRARLIKEINARELELFRLKSDRYPADANFRTELGIRLYRAAQIDEAIKELQTAKNDPRQQWRCLLWLGHCFKARNNWKLARRNLEEALQALPGTEEKTRKEVLFLLAQGCAESGDLQAAVDLGNDLANMDFGYKDIGRLLDEWQGRLDKIQSTGKRDSHHG